MIVKALTFCAALLLGLLAAHPFALAQAKTDIVPDVWQGDVLRPKPDQFSSIGFASLPTATIRPSIISTRRAC